MSEVSIIMEMNLTCTLTSKLAEDYYRERDRAEDGNKEQNQQEIFAVSGDRETAGYNWTM